MRKIPPELKNEILEDPFYKECSRKSFVCEGRITWEHTLIYGGQQINEKWAIIPLCIFHHLGKGLIKEINVAIALNRATDDELLKYSKVINYKRERDRLNKKYFTKPYEQRNK